MYLLINFSLLLMLIWLLYITGFWSLSPQAVSCAETWSILVISHINLIFLGFEGDCQSTKHR